MYSINDWHTNQTHWQYIGMLTLLTLSYLNLLGCQYYQYIVTRTHKFNWYWLYIYSTTYSSRNQPKNACPNMRAFMISSKGKTWMSVFTYNTQFLRLYVKTLIKNFPLELIVKSRMFGHAFLGRFRDDYCHILPVVTVQLLLKTIH